MRYLDPKADLTFKKIFGEHKDLLISLLNALLPLADDEQIESVEYLSPELVPETYIGKNSIVDVRCRDVKGRQFIVEMQNAYQTFFKDRSLYYATFPIREQAEKGDVWDYQLKHVYVVALLNYKMSDSAFSPDTINHDIGLLDKQTHRVFNDKLTFKYVEISKFDKCLEELESNYDKWLYVLRNLSRLDSQPDYLRNEIFNRLFSEAEIAHFSKVELREYEDSLKAYRDIKNSLDTAKAEGLAEGFGKGRVEGHAEGLVEGRAEGLAKGRAEGRSETLVEVAKNLLSIGTPIESIMKATGLSEEEIKSMI